MEAAELSIRGWVTALDADSRGGDSLAHRSSVSVSLCLIEVLTTFLLTVPSELGIRLAASPGVPTLRRVISHAAKSFLFGSTLVYPVYWFSGSQCDPTSYRRLSFSESVDRGFRIAFGP